MDDKGVMRGHVTVFGFTRVSGPGKEDENCSFECLGNELRYGQTVVEA